MFLIGLFLLLAVALADLGALVAARLVVARALGIPGVRFPFRTDAATSREGTSGWARPACALAALVALYLVTTTFAALGYLVMGKQEPVMDGTVDVLPGGAAEAAGMRDGDRVTAIAGAPIHAWSQIAETVKVHPGEPLDFAIEREGRTIHVEVTPGPRGSPSEGKIRVRPPA
jgi:membrane-associated protease RseP (regulator of RpoE activity)